MRFSQIRSECGGHHDFRETICPGLEAMKHGRTCLSTLATNYRQGFELQALAEQTGRILMVGHLLEYPCRPLSELMNSGPWDGPFTSIRTVLISGKFASKKAHCGASRPRSQSRFRLVGEDPWSDVHWRKLYYS
jgi:hypothetical protein